MSGIDGPLKWVEFKRQGKLPPERRSVLVMIPRRQSDNAKLAARDYGGDPEFCDIPPTVAVGYLRVHSGGPFFVIPGVGGHVTHWCDCLGDEFSAPLWQSKQVVGPHKRVWFAA